MDLDERAYREGCAILDIQTSALRRYGEIVAAQGAALGADDMDRVADLAEHVDRLIAELSASGRRMAPLHDRLREGRLAGPRAEALRARTDAIGDLAGAAERAVRGLVSELVRRRNDVRRQLATLDAAAVAGTSYAVAAASPRGAFDRLI